MKSYFYKIQCITNLHMGSGEINFNVIDNEVERDPVDNRPVMFSSGVKGALKDHFHNQGVGMDTIKDIFGSEIDRNPNENSVPGKTRFLTACLILLPFRAAFGRYPYYLATTKGILQQFGSLYKNIKGTELVEGFEAAVSGLDGKETYGIETDPVKLEDYKYSNIQPVPKAISKALGFFVNNESIQKVMIIPDFDFGGGRNRVVLPVLARNRLDAQGISQSLWYEEVVPHESVFYLPVLSNETADGDRALDTFHSSITAGGGSLVQFGANATIGYGLTRVSAL